MRADRLPAIVLLLQSRSRLSASQPAAELEVSPRTIYRDVVALSRAGIPIHADANGHRLVDGHTWHKLMSRIPQLEPHIPALVSPQAAEPGLMTDEQCEGRGMAASARLGG